MTALLGHSLDVITCAGRRRKLLNLLTLIRKTDIMIIGTITISVTRLNVWP